MNINRVLSRDKCCNATIQFNIFSEILHCSLIKTFDYQWLKGSFQFVVDAEAKFPVVSLEICSCKYFLFIYFFIFNSAAADAIVAVPSACRFVSLVSVLSLRVAFCNFCCLACCCCCRIFFVFSSVVAGYSRVILHFVVVSDASNPSSVSRSLHYLFLPSFAHIPSILYGIYGRGVSFLPDLSVVFYTVQFSSILFGCIQFCDGEEREVSPCGNFFAGPLVLQFLLFST